jgi:broad specificity phosphatase PhoE
VLLLIGDSRASNPMTFDFLRHVQTLREEEKVSMSEVSRRQLDERIHVLRPHPISMLYSSDLWRAVQPAQALAKSLGSSFRSSSPLREIEPGLEIPVPPPGTHDREDIDAFEQRVASALDDIVGQNEHTHVLVFAHSRTIQSAVRHLLEGPLVSVVLAAGSQDGLVALTRDVFGKWHSPT